MKYNILKNSKGEILLEVTPGEKMVYLLNLTKSLEDHIKIWIHDKMDIEEHKKLVPVTKEEKENALSSVRTRMENPTISKKGWNQIKLFLLASLEE